MHLSVYAQDCQALYFGLVPDRGWAYYNCQQHGRQDCQTMRQVVAFWHLLCHDHGGPFTGTRDVSAEAKAIAQTANETQAGQEIQRSWQARD
jgi:hypothetical protein